MLCEVHVASAQAGVLLVLGAMPWQREVLCAELAWHDPHVAQPFDINTDVRAWAEPPWASSPGSPRTLLPAALDRQNTA